MGRTISQTVANKIVEFVKNVMFSPGFTCWFVYQPDPSQSYELVFVIFLERLKLLCLVLKMICNDFFGC